MITFQLTVAQFQNLLNAILAADTPDDLTNLVLMACTRPRDGVISVPVAAGDARAIYEVVRAKAATDPSLATLAQLLAAQLENASTES